MRDYEDWVVCADFIGTELPKDLDEKFKIMITDKTYCNLIDNLMSMEEKYGFQFLNSEQCVELFENIKTLEKLILKNMGDDILFRIDQLGDESIDKYENEIIKNVYSYSEENKFNKAVLFIGAAHRKSLMQKIPEYQMKQKVKLNWTF